MSGMLRRKSYTIGCVELRSYQDTRHQIELFANDVRQSEKVGLGGLGLLNVSFVLSGAV